MKAKLSDKRKKEIIEKYGEIPTKKELFDKLAETQERLVISLAMAWEVVPDDPKRKEDLLKATERAMKLREKIYKNVIKKEPPELRQSYEKLSRVLASNNK